MLSKPTINDWRSPNIKRFYTHVIEYKSDNNARQKIYIKPTIDEIAEIKAQRKEYWILQEDVQKNLMYLFIDGTIAALIALLITN